ncbi:N-acetyltransferase [Azorhizobium oxalatiphilum]|uniref:N-acetyltransferase n=1 Tax=Azorhizobium oxalatiphilum TaxID=980631 RepID=A0A917F6V9_9HYPH|nr:GNAT family protein [Azorhizobium oxalatiphilum]GGF52118.1 N-acetyltransferase [Azorhizobium oxalatiphilum]
MSQTTSPGIGPQGEPVTGGPARPPERVTLEGRHIDVRPFDVDLHAADLFAASHGSAARDALWDYLSVPPFKDLDAFRASYAEAAKKDDPLMFALVDKASGKAVGHATYMRIEPKQRVIEVGNILYTPSLQRSPAATEAMYLMARHAFEDLGYRRYEWKCNALNLPSRRAADRLGFTYEGLFRQHMIVKGQNRDTAWFSLLDHEWPHAKAAFEAWLAPENFEQDGTQKRRLQDFRTK